MSKKQYERMYPKDPKCPFSDTRRKCSDDCGNVWFCDMCEWWKDYIKRSDDKCEGCTLRELSIETFNDKKGEK